MNTVFVFNSGWGESFHFAPMYVDSNFKQNIARHEDFLALKLGLKATDLCIDVGCGVGGPMREIAKFSGAQVVGLNNNAYQVERCNYLAKKYGLAEKVSVIKVYFVDAGRL
jgi:sterol 24-C-methyltransferase